MKNYAVLLAPEFRLQAMLRYSPNLIERPVALLEVQGTKSRVCEMTAAAGAFQVQRAMTPTQAMARCPDLHLIHGNAGQEKSAQEALLQTAESLSPFVESTQPGVVTVELPSEPVFSEKDFREKIVRPLLGLGLDVRVGRASTPDLALLAARQARPVKLVERAADFLGPLPVDTLQPSDDLAHVLESWGIHTIGQFTALPSAQVWDRLGPEAVHLVERAKGGRPRPLNLVKPQELFTEESNLENPVEMLEPLFFLLRRFLEQMAVRLANAYRVAGRLRLVLRFEKGETYHRVFTLPQPTRDVNLLFRMLHAHLENFTSPTPIIGLELAAAPVRPNTDQFDLLNPGLRDPYQFSDTLARLQGLLGADRVGTPEIEPSHHPDAFHLSRYDPESPLPPENDEPLIGAPWLRFRPPIPANIILKDVQPAFLYSSRSTGAIRDARGPWLLEGNWWEDRHWSREEWDIATEDGIYRLVHTGQQWFLDGIYA